MTGRAFETKEETDKPHIPAQVDYVVDDKVDIVHKSDANEFAKVASPDTKKKC